MAEETPRQAATEAAGQTKIAQQDKVPGFDTAEMKQALRSLKEVEKQQDLINAKISAATELTRELKELDNLLMKEKVKQKLLQQDLADMQRESPGIQQRVVNLQKELAAAKEKEKKQEEALRVVQEARHKIKEYDFAAAEDLLKNDLKQIKNAKERERVERERRKEISEAARAREKEIKDADKLVENAEEQLIKDREAVLTAEKAFGPAEARYFLLEKALEVQEETLDKLEEEKQKRKQINERIGITGLLAKGATNALAKIGMQSFADLEGLNKKMEEAAGKGAGKWKMLGIIGKHAVQSIGKALTDPAFILTSIVGAATALWKAAMNYEKHVTEAAKSLGLNLNQTKELYNNFKHIADENASIGMTGHQLMETYKGMNDQLGFMSNTNSEFLTTSAGLQRRLGLTANDMANVALFSDKTKKSTADTFNTIIGTAKAQMGKLKFAMSEKQVMDGIGKVSATVFANFKGNVAQLGAAVVKATKFGTTLDEINNAGKSMLDFESSISKEFEAQLLTGKNINLSKAREYALTGQTDKLMDEITKNLGSQAEWNKMNVLQQQSLAEAMGMSKEQVDEMFKKQKLASVLGKEAGADAATQYQKLRDKKMTHEQIAEIMGKDAAQQAIQASTQEKMAASIERMTNAFEKLSNELLKPIIDQVNKMLNGTDDIAGKIKMMATFASGFLKTYLFIKGVMVAMKAYQAAMVLQQQAMVLYENRKKIAMVAQLSMAKFLHVLGIRRLANDRLEEITKGRIAIKERIAAALGAVRAGTQAAAASAGPTLGFGSLAIGAAVVGGLLAMLASVGGGGGEGGGGAGSVSAPEMPKIEPMNEKAEGAKTQNQSITRAKEERQVANFIRVDAVTGIAVAKQSDQEVKADYSKVQ